MSFGIKKNNDITYIYSNAATGGGSSVSNVNPQLFVSGTTFLTTSSPTVVILNAGASEANIVLPLLTSDNNGLTFTVRYFGTNAGACFVTSNGGQQIYISNTGSATSFAFGSFAGFARTLIAYNNGWYSIGS